MTAGGPDRHHLIGILLVDKSAGPTSHDVVVRARRVLGERRIGHAGTLDPFATGLLILCVGPAARLVELLQMLPKRYEASLRLGEETDTHDLEGTVIRRSERWRDVTRRHLEEALRDQTGWIRQVPPAYSAKRVGGRRAHEMARRGEAVDLEPVRVQVRELRILDFSPPNVNMEVEVSTGTYIRALARDVGRALDCGAHLRRLRRTRVGPFRVEDAIPSPRLQGSDRDERLLRELGAHREAEAESADDGQSAGWLTPAQALKWLPVRRLEDDEAKRVRHGAPVPRGRLRAPHVDRSLAEADGEDPPVAMLHHGRLLAVAEIDGVHLRPRKVFATR